MIKEIKNGNELKWLTKEFKGVLISVYIIISPSLTNYLWGDTYTPKVKYEKKYKFDYKFHMEKENPSCVYIIDSGNVYELHYKNPYVEVFNNKGNPLRTFKCNWKGGEPNVTYRLLMDDKGNMLVYTPWTNNANNFILDKDGNLLKTFFCGVTWPWKIGFENGVVYDKANGIVLGAIDEKRGEIKQKIFFKDIDDLYNPHDLQEPHRGVKIKKHIRQIKLPKYLQQIDGSYVEIEKIKEMPFGLYTTPPKGFDGKFKYEEIIDMDEQGNIYARYETPPIRIGDKYTGKVNQAFKIFVFNPNFKLLTVLDAKDIGFPDLPTRNLYELKPGPEPGDIKVYKWEKMH